MKSWICTFENQLKKRRYFASMGSLRWTFNFGNWQPNELQWMQAIQCVQQEERERVSRFLYRKDAKSALIGRLLIRKCVSEVLSIPYRDVLLARTERNKPILQNAGSTKMFSNLDFNVSHAGSFAVLASELGHRVGVDVMDFGMPANKDVKEFFRLMTRQFTKDEWVSIRKAPTEALQLANFYRHWCLKESYIKAVGVGLGMDLLRLHFHIKTEKLGSDFVTSDTELYIDGHITSEWTFHESLLDDKHCVAVAVEGNEHSSRQDSAENEKKIFKVLDFDDLIACSEPLRPASQSHWTNFVDKEERPKILQQPS